MGGNRKLEVFKENVPLNKKEVLLIVERMIEHYKEDDEEQWNDALKKRRIELFKKFKTDIEALEDFEITEDWYYYEYNMTATELYLNLMLCTNIEVDANEEIIRMQCQEEEKLVSTKCEYIPISDFARLYDIKESTVKKWIRECKIHHLIKENDGWMISELEEPPRRGHYSVHYAWKKDLQMEALKSSYAGNNIYIFQNPEDAQSYIGILRNLQGEGERIEFTNKERIQAERELLSNRDVEIVDYKIMYVPDKYEIAEAWKKELQTTEEEDDELWYGPVIVTRGQHKGRIGYYDDDDIGNKAIVYWGDMLLCHHYTFIRRDYLSNNISTRQLIERAQALRHEIAMLSWSSGADIEVRQLLSELLMVEEMLSTRYYETIFLTSEKNIEVYIAYADDDTEFARCLATDLKNKGYEVFIKDWSILVGDIKLDKMGQGLCRASALVPLISKSFLASEECKLEWTSYLTKKEDSVRPVIPIVIDESEVPGFLSVYKEYRNDALSGSYEHMLEMLLMKLKDIEKNLQEENNE